MSVVREVVTHTGARYVMTDQHRDPCAYCVGWDEPADPYAAEARPIWPDGSTVERIYRGVHRRCDERVAAYVAEAAQYR